MFLRLAYGTPESERITWGACGKMRIPDTPDLQNQNLGG